MPNKRANAKMMLNKLKKGKLSTAKNVQNTLQYLIEKAKVDNEDVNYDIELEASAGLEPLGAGDDDVARLKRKAAKSGANRRTNDRKKPKFELPVPETKQKKQKTTDDLETFVKKTNEKKELIPQKSKNNKYFFMAHPEALKKKSQIINQQPLNSKKEFIIDSEKMKFNKVIQLQKDNLKKEKIIAESAVNKPKKIKNKMSNNVWLVEEDVSESDSESKPTDNGENIEEEETTPKKSDKKSKKKSSKTDFDESKYKVTKKVETLEDGTMIETFMPEYEGEDEDEEVSEGSDGEEFEDIDSDELGSDLDDDDDEAADEEEEITDKKEKVTNKNGQENDRSSASVRNKMLEQLQSSRFRYLNELLYTQQSDKSFQYFKEDKDAFNVYHLGFQNQKVKWPLNPLEVIINYIKSKSSNLIVADFGCGEAKLASSVKNKVHSFDLVALNDLVVACDMKNVPLNKESCDIAVFCLSLMGVNVIDFLCEAHRVLKPKGVLKIAEVVSRIENKHMFVRQVESIGFKLVNNREEKKPASKTEANYFYFFDFVKVSPTVKGRPNIQLKACVYKKR